jgi:hypothetical protein
MRRATSVTVVVAFVVMIVTSLAMELSHGPGPGAGAGPEGQHPNVSSDVSGIGGGAGPGPGPGRRASSFFPKKLHEIGGYVMMAAGIVHLAFNYRVLLSYLGVKGRRVRECRDGLAEAVSS